MKIDKESITWAIKHIKNQKDTDLFPRLKEYDVLFEDENYLTEKLSEIDIGNYSWQSYRRFIIPKDEYSYRVAIQLDPVDNLLLVALTYQFGNKIEEKRIPLEEKKVFNYRFMPNSEGEFYNKKEAWKDFWSTASIICKQYNYVVYIDIADFYNRIYHHTLENQLIDCGIENQVIKAIKSMLQNTTQTTSQGIPVGPHAIHIYAEMCLIPIDESLSAKGYDFCRYSDDIVIFVNTKVQGQIVIYEMAKMLDSLKLNIQRHKTRIYSKEEFQNHCEEMFNDNPINELEKEMIDIINEYSTDPYAMIGISNISEVDREVFSPDRIERILVGYFEKNPDYQRIRWLFRRLSNVGVDTAINIAVKEIERLTPAISDVALYFASVAEESDSALDEIGGELLKLLNNPIIKSNDFFQISVLNLFTNTNKFDNITTLMGMFNSSNEYIKREIILAAYSAKIKSWIREIKQEYQSLGIWGQRALLISSELLPKDERKFFIQNMMSNQNNLALEIIAKNTLKK
ncbi:RNA-directed DNA polymerase [Lachnospiraceae bacterium LCP25S3_G4]